MPCQVPGRLLKPFRHNTNDTSPGRADSVQNLWNSRRLRRWILLFRYTILWENFLCWLHGQLMTKVDCRADKRTKKKLNKQSGCFKIPTKVTNRNGSLSNAEKWKALGINYDNCSASSAETCRQNNEARRKVQQKCTRICVNYCILWSRAWYWDHKDVMRSVLGGRIVVEE